MNTKYGNYSSTQIHSAKISLRKAIFFLLLYVDPATAGEYPNADIEGAFQNLQYKLNGLNSILLESSELIETMSLLESALKEFQSDSFDWLKYRKLVLDAGARIMDVKEGD